MNQLAIAAYGNFSVALAGEGTIGAEEAHFFRIWNSFFNASLPICNNRSYIMREERRERVFFESLAKVDREYVIAFKRAIYTGYYTYTEDTKTYIARSLESYGLPDKYFGVHIRHGDKFGEAPAVDTEAYINSVKSMKDLNI